MARCPRSGRKTQSLTLELLQLESYIRKITPVVQQLQEEFPDLKYDKRSVAQLVADVLQFMENALGAQARRISQLMNFKKSRILSVVNWGLYTLQALPPQKPFPKLPRKLFRNYDPQGSLYRILQLLSDIRRSRGMKNFNFQDLGRRKEVIALPEMHMIIQVIAGLFCAA